MGTFFLFATKAEPGRIANGDKPTTATCRAGAAGEGRAARGCLGRSLSTPRETATVCGIGALIVRVHKLAPKAAWSRRYDLINAFEKSLVEHETHILKFYLHISREEQLKRFKDRLDDPTKQWKISEDDYKERRFWDEYMEAYEDALSRCSTEVAPWFIIPANHKWFRNLAVARILVEYLETLKMKYPQSMVDLERIRREYHAAKQE